MLQPPPLKGGTPVRLFSAQITPVLVMATCVLTITGAAPYMGFGLALSGAALPNALLGLIYGHFFSFPLYIYIRVASVALRF